MLPRQHVVLKFLIVCLATYGICNFFSSWTTPRFIELDIKHHHHSLVKVNSLEAIPDPEFYNIVITNISNIHMDVNKAAVFYVGDNYLVITCLLLTYRNNEQKFANIRLIVRKDAEIVYEKPVSLETVYQSENYIFSVIKQNLTQEICSSNCEKNLRDSNVLTFQLKINDQWSPRSTINVVYQRPNSLKNNLAARLIKCMWLPKDVRLFEYIMRLIIESNYDSIYICLFKKDLKLKSVLSNFNSTKMINLIELNNIPNCFPNGTDFTYYDQVLKEDRIGDKGEVFDVVNEFLLNQMYPFLIEKYRYVHAADFDHILFTRNLSFIDRIEQIKKKNHITDYSSLYFNQYWALPNNMSRYIFQKVNKRLNNSEDEETNEPIHVEIEKLAFTVELKNDKEVDYALKIHKYLRRKSYNEQFRHVIFKFTHPHIYGQMVHSTESSMIIKLCSAGVFFSNGSTVTIKSPHLVHYRDQFAFKLLRFKDRFIFMNSFSLWPDFELSEY